MLTWVAGMSSALGALWVPLAALVGVVTGGLLAGGFAASRRATPARGENLEPQGQAQQVATVSPVALVLGPRPLEAGQLDLEMELGACVQARDARAADRHVRLETAIQPELTVRADAGALRQAVLDVLDNAIGHSNGGRVLLAAGRHGGRVQIVVLDDGAAVDRAEQEAHLRGAERLVALQGGTFDISVRPDAGSTVTIRLPEPGPIRAAQPAPAPPAAAPAAVSPKAARRADAVQTER